MYFHAHTTCIKQHHHLTGTVRHVSVEMFGFVLRRGSQHLAARPSSEQGRCRSALPAVQLLECDGRRTKGSAATARPGQYHKISRGAVASHRQPLHLHLTILGRAHMICNLHHSRVRDARLQKSMLPTHPAQILCFSAACEQNDPDRP